MRLLPRLVNRFDAAAERASGPARVLLAAGHRERVPESEVPPTGPVVRRARPVKGHLRHAPRDLDPVRVDRHEAPL